MAENNHNCKSPATLLDLDRATEKPASLSDFQEDVYKELECPVCLEIAVPPVALCRAGHFVCGICRPKLQRCVICRDKYTEARNYAIENIVSKIKVKCRNNSCKKILNVAELGEHLKHCDYRPIVCNLDNGTACKNNVISYEEYMDHLKNKHLTGVSTTPIFEFGVSSFSRWIIRERRNNSLVWPKIAYEHHGVTYILNMEIKESEVYFWVSAFSTTDQARKMVADLQIGQSPGEQINSERTNIKWTIGILPVQLSLSDVRNSGNFVSFPANRLILLARTNEAAPFSFLVELTLRKAPLQGTSVPFDAPSGTDEILKNNVPFKIETCHQCITCMKEYEHKSLEELRLEDYEFGRKGSFQQATELVFGKQTQPTTQQSTVSSVQTATRQPPTSSGGFGSRIRILPQAKWACVRCTFLNDENNSNCGVCYFPRAN